MFVGGAVGLLAVCASTSVTRADDESAPPPRHSDAGAWREFEREFDSPRLAQRDERDRPARDGRGEGRRGPRGEAGRDGRPGDAGPGEGRDMHEPRDGGARGEAGHAEAGREGPRGEAGHGGDREKAHAVDRRNVVDQFAMERGGRRPPRADRGDDRRGPPTLAAIGTGAIAAG